MPDNYQDIKKIPQNRLLTVWLFTKNKTKKNRPENVYN